PGAASDVESLLVRLDRLEKRVAVTGSLATVVATAATSPPSAGRKQASDTSPPDSSPPSPSATYGSEPVTALEDPGGQPHASEAPAAEVAAAPAPDVPESVAAPALANAGSGGSDLSAVR